MADFGEYLPYAEDVLFYDGEDGTEWHNKFSEKWAKLNMQVCQPLKFRPLISSQNMPKCVTEPDYNGLIINFLERHLFSVNSYQEAILAHGYTTYVKKL
jgi:hypothetical protein